MKTNVFNIFVLNYIKSIESWSSSQHQLLSRPSSANFDYKLPVDGILSINVLFVNKFSQFIEDKNRGNRDSIVITISFVINTVQINEGQKTWMKAKS